MSNTKINVKEDLDEFDKIDRIKKLVNILNGYNDSYYNKDKMEVSDKRYDKLFYELEELEKSTGFILSNSPTQNVGYTVQSKLKKVEHDHLMLSLDKAHSFKEIVDYSYNNSKKDLIGMLKLDGLTMSVQYDTSGNLVKAETRGNGEIGEDVLENAKMITNLPTHINTNGVSLTIDGEVIVKKDAFNEINSKLNEGERFSHPRNYASGSIRQLDNKITKERNLSFVAWRCIEGLNNKFLDEDFYFLEKMGFEVVPSIVVWGDSLIEKNVEKAKEYLYNEAKTKNYPIDGLVFAFNDVAFGKSLGRTTHHWRYAIAWKDVPDSYETILLDIEWNVGRTGVVAPTAIFEPVDMNGTVVSRSTLHNISYIKDLELGIGDTIVVVRANEVIPRVEDNLTRSNNIVFPTHCPSCGSKLEVSEDGLAEVLYCKNPKCPAKMLNKFVHFVSKPGMNIDGLSESTLEKFIDKGFIESYADIYRLENHKNEIINMEGFGSKSYKKLIDSINVSRRVKLDNFLTAMGIPMVGKSACKTIAKTFGYDWHKFIDAVLNGYDFTQLEDFGEIMANNVIDFFADFQGEFAQMSGKGFLDEINFIKEEKKETVQNDTSNEFFNGKTFVVTGKFITCNRDTIESLITERGGKLAGSVSKKTDYLLTNDGESGSSKAIKAKELGIPIMSEIEFFKRVNGEL